MRLEKIEEGEVIIIIYDFYDFTDCGEHYLLTYWCNEEKVTVTLNKDTNLEDLLEKHGGYIKYAKFCMKTFQPYESDNRDAKASSNLDEVINWKSISPDSWRVGCLLKVLITEEELEEIDISPLIVRYPTKERGRGTHWYQLLENRVGEMKLEKIKGDEETTSREIHDFTDRGEYYLLTCLDNETGITVTLNQNTNLEDLHKEHGGSIYYSKFCRTTFRLYKSMSGSLHDEDLDKVISWTEIDNTQWWVTRFLRALITGEVLIGRSFGSCIVRYPTEERERGQDWYRLVKG